MRSPARIRSGGLTLMELLIGLIIVGILVSMALPGFGKAMEKARVKDTQAILASIATAERVYRIDQGGFGSLADLMANRYVTDPDPGSTGPGTGSNTDWDFTSTNTNATFTMTATRTGGGAQYNTKTVKVDQRFSGSPPPLPEYGNKIYDGTHDLRD